MERGEKISIIVMIVLMTFLFTFVLFFSGENSLIGLTIFQEQPTPAGGNDTYIRNNSILNFGSDTVIKLGKTAAGAQIRGLIQFNVSSISSEDTITDAVIELYASTLNVANVTVTAYRITSSWNESTTTWDNKTATSLWTAKGGDFNTIELSTVVIDASGNWFNFSILDATKGWVNGSYPNLGIILVPSAETSDSDLTELISSDYTADASLRPKITIDHTENAAPTIVNITIDSNLTNLLTVGDNVSFTTSWTDPESDNAQLYVCNSSVVNITGCGGTAFCNTSLSATTPTSCSYTIQEDDNRTTNVFISACDSANCSTANQTSFSMNHLPVTIVTTPNGGETANQSIGNFAIEFNVSDADSDAMIADLYYSSTGNSITNVINTSLNLTNACTDGDSDTSTTNNCTYSWNTTGLFGNFFITIIVNDSYHEGNDSSDSSFSVVSLTDIIAPNITAQWIETTSSIYSGRYVQIYANVSDINLRTVWFTINTTPQQNITMTNDTHGGITYNASFRADSVANYNFKTYANDTLGNVNNTLSATDFSVVIPTATIQSVLSPNISTPFNLIKFTSDLNATNDLRDVFAYLFVPDGFTFLSGYDQNTNTGNYTENETKTATWFISTPITESNYTLNVSFTDYYSNEWNSSNKNLIIQQSATSRFLSMSGYPEVETGESYFAQAFFTNNGLAEAADSAVISIYDSIGSLIVGPASMSNPETGTYNYTYSVGSSVNEGQWETIINATKNSVNYLTNQFWKVVGGPFDVRDIVIDNSAIDALQITVTTENTGGAIKDLSMSWNLTKESTGEVFDSGADTFAVNAYSNKTYTITPTTTFVGQSRITFLGFFSGTEKAGAYKVFSTTAGSGGGGTPGGGTPGGGSPGGGGGGSSGSSSTGITTNTNLSMNFEKEISLTKNIKKEIEVEIENTGTTTLTNITLNLDGLTDEYTLSPEIIASLGPGKKAIFEIEFLITDFIGEKEFTYVLKTNELTKKAEGKLIVLNINEFFAKEVERLRNLIKALENKTTDEKLLDELNVCKKIVDELEENIGKEEFINAQDNLNKADTCIKEVEEKIEKGEGIFKRINMPNITLIIVIALIILVAIVVYFLYRIYKTLNILTFFKKTENLPKSASGIKQEEFNQKIGKIERALGVEKSKPILKSSQETDKKFKEIKKKE